MPGKDEIMRATTRYTHYAAGRECYVSASKRLTCKWAQYSHGPRCEWIMMMRRNREHDQIRALCSMR